MMNNSDKERAYLKAKDRVDKIRKFYTHLAVYIVVNIAFSTLKIIRNLNHGESFKDAFFDFNLSGIWLFWGIGLALHAFSVFGLPMILGNNWEDEKIKQFMDEEKRNNFN